MPKAKFDHELALSKYQQGMTLHAIAEEFGVSRIAVYKAMKKFGVSVERRSYAPRRGRVGACGICGHTKRLVQDHCHTTGLCRGLLCERCNRMLGYIEQPPVATPEQLAYISRWQAAHASGEGRPYQAHEHTSYALIASGEEVV